MSYGFSINLNLSCRFFWVLVFPGRLWGVVWRFVTLLRCCFGVSSGLGLLVGFRDLVFGFAFGLFFGFIRPMSRNKASAVNGRLGGRPPSLVCSVSPAGVPSWSLAGDVVSPRVLSGGWVECGGRFYSAVVGSTYPAPGVHRFAARRCGPVESASVESVPAPAPALDDIIYLPCGSPVRRSHIWVDMERVRLAAIEAAMGDI